MSENIWQQEIGKNHEGLTEEWLQQSLQEIVEADLLQEGFVIEAFHLLPPHPSD